MRVHMLMISLVVAVVFAQSGHAQAQRSQEKRAQDKRVQAAQRAQEKRAQEQRLSQTTGKPPVPQPGKNRVYVGTYNEGGKSKGIYQFEFDAQRGEATEPELAAEARDPSFLAIHPSGEYLFAVNEISDFEGKSSGALSSFEIDEETGKLKLINQQPSQGAAPCHLTIDGTGHFLLAVNYEGGSTVCVPILTEGKLGSATSFIQHKGSSIDKPRQSAPHAHSVNLDRGNRFVFVADLGLDQILINRFDSIAGTLEPAAAVKIAPGSGPRHFAFDPFGKHAYVINEIKSTVTAFAYDSENGELKEIQTISALPEGFTGANGTADIQVHPSGKFVYGSNRGHDSIAMFVVDPESGKLGSLGQEPTQGKTPRNFGIDPSGNYLLAENQGSGTIIVFQIDQISGKLKPTGKTIIVPAPVCLKFLPLHK